MAKLHWMIRLTRTIAILFVLLGCLVVLLYTPFYANLMVRILNTMVPVEVNQVAAKSQQMAALTEEENLEPGSSLWIARQAYLQLMEEQLEQNDAHRLNILQIRYKILLSKIKMQQEHGLHQQKKPVIPSVSEQLEPGLAAEQHSVDHSVLASAPHSADANPELADIKDSEDQMLMDSYLNFLKTYKVSAETASKYAESDPQLSRDIAYINAQNQEKKKTPSQPYAIVVLGGGLTLDKNQKDIIVNKYTRLRLETTLEMEKKTGLPIVLSGVEAPYMQTWLMKHHVDARLLENRSMNTCENTRFSSLLLQKKGGAPTVLLITDRYHMPRTRRLFALNGIETIPVEAPMPTQLTQWKPGQQNYDHSRRANYELLATIRDMYFGSGGCREVP
ncbi:YdcF family protein [Acinetobacter sp. WZC-1]|uniref:YdcF family protein n=1 Tax=Acinetobacter sp. WZC-1 TaxID=3459034 RepID=UPI00403D82CB